VAHRQVHWDLEIVPKIIANFSRSANDDRVRVSALQNNLEEADVNVGPETPVGDKRLWFDPQTYK